MIKNVTIPSKYKYLSEFTNELPKNCLFSKGGTGVGGTTLAINSAENYVICVPFKSMIENKCSQHNNIFGVKSSVNKDLFNRYTNKCKKSKTPIKIMVTYNSLYKVVNFLESDVKDYNLLVDESHLLLTEYKYRRDAIYSVLDNYKLFKSYTFMTATPIEDEFNLVELVDIPKVNYQFENITNVTVESVTCACPINTACNIILSNLKSEQRFYFFVNSITIINDIVDKCNLDDNSARMICSSTSSKKTLLKKSDTLSDPKKFNFLTSTAWEGCDLYDEQGVIFMISDSRKAHTLKDISTSLVQIAGRIRDTVYKDKIYHLYNKTRYNNVSIEEFNKLCDENTAKCLRIVDNTHDWVEGDAEYFGGKNIDSTYLRLEGGKIVFDENSIKLDKYNYNIINGVYKIQTVMEDKYKSSNFNVEWKSDSYKKIEKPKEKVVRVTKRFKDVVLELKKIYSDKINNLIFEGNYTEEYYNRYPFLKDAINYLGFDGIHKLRYIQKDIKSELDKLNTTKTITTPDKNNIENSKLTKIHKISKLKTNDFISKSDAKLLLQKIYTNLNIITVPKSKDLEKYYDLKTYKKTIDKKRVDGYLIIRPKIIF